MVDVLQFVVNGLVEGVLYSLLAIGFALVYNTTKVFHIAAAGIYAFAAVMFYRFSSQLPLMASATVAVTLTMVLSWLTEVSVYRPLQRRNASNNVTMIASIGVMTVIVNLLAMFFGNHTMIVDNTTRPSLPAIGNVILTARQLWIFAVGGGVIVAFLFFIALSGWGTRVRAMSADSVLFGTLGYDVTKTRSLVFLASGAFIGIASCLKAFDVGFDVQGGMPMLIYAMVAMIIGGMGRFGTCVVGGLVLGVIQAMTGHFFSDNWRDAIVFTLLLLILLLRPQGIAGYKQRTV